MDKGLKVEIGYDLCGNMGVFGVFRIFFGGEPSPLLASSETHHPPLPYQPTFACVRQGGGYPCAPLLHTLATHLHTYIYGGMGMQ